MRTFLSLCLLCLMTIVATESVSARESTYQIAQAATPEAYGRIGSAAVQAAEPGPEAYARIAAELSMLSETQISFDRVRATAGEILVHIPALGADLRKLFATRSPTGEGGYFLGLLLWVTLFVFIAYQIEYHIFTVRVCKPWFRSLRKDKPVGLVEKLPVLAFRAGTSMMGVLLSMFIASLLILGFLDTSNDITQKTIIVIMLSIAVARAAVIVWRMVLAPYFPDYRIACLTDREAQKLFLWLCGTIVISVALLAFCYWIQDIGALLRTYNAISLIATGVMVVLNVVMVLANRRTITDAILGQCHTSTVSTFQRVCSMLWAPAAIIYFVGASLVLSYRLLSGSMSGAPLIVGAYTVLIAILVAYGVVAFAIARVFRHRRSIVVARQRAEQGVPPEREQTFIEQAYIEGDPLEGDGDEESGPAAGAPDRIQGTRAQATLHGMRDFEDLAKRTASIFALGAGIYALLHIWDFAYLLDEGGALDPVQDVIDICLAGYLLYNAARIWIDTRIQEEGGADLNLGPGDEGSSANAASRLATLLPLFRNFGLFTISATALVMILLEIGINVAPLFAGAGVVGLAIGFGAQALIRDILSGAFFLIDDAFRKGEYIDIGTVKGTVEKISLRSFQLRHHLGALHTIPFGEITHLTNYSRDWVMVKLPLRVTYDTDVEKVRKLIKKLGAELMEHPTEGAKFMQPLKSQGIYRMEDSAMIIRVKFMTRPGDQWTTRKLVYSRLRELFSENGVKFAHREVTVRLSDMDHEGMEGSNMLTKDEREAIAGAALTAVHVAEAEAANPRKIVGDDR